MKNIMKMIGLMMHSSFYMNQEPLDEHEDCDEDYEEDYRYNDDWD